MYEENGIGVLPEEEFYPARMKDYDVPWWVQMVHSLPRFDLTFEHVKPYFDLNDNKYRESVLFWIALPILWLLITLFLFLIYFCYRCCQKGNPNKNKINCLKWFISILTIISCATVGLGIYGNEDANKGIERSLKSSNDITITLSKIKNNINNLYKLINSTTTVGFQRLDDLFRINRIDISRKVIEIKESLIGMFTHLEEVMRKKMMGFSFQNYLEIIQNYENYRRYSCLGLFSWFGLLLLILLVGIGNHSKCTLLLFCAFGIFSLVLSGLFSGFQLGLSVAVGDFCSDPDSIVSNYLEQYLEPTTTDYYIQCDSVEINPFSTIMKKFTDNLIIVNQSIFQLKNENSNLHGIIPLYNQLQHNQSEIRSLSYSLFSLVECTNIHKDYLNILDSICYQSMPGLLLMFLSSLSIGFFFSILIIFSSKIWRTMGLYKGYNEGEDEEEGGPFISTSSNPHPHSSPSYYGYPKSRPASSHGYDRRTTPPPAYNSNEFYRQYNDIA